MKVRVPPLPDAAAAAAAAGEVSQLEEGATAEEHAACAGMCGRSEGGNRLGGERARVHVRAKVQTVPQGRTMHPWRWSAGPWTIQCARASLWPLA